MKWINPVDIQFVLFVNAFPFLPRQISTSSEGTGLETSYLNHVAHRTHCGKLLVHFQWITFYERSDKFAVDDCLGGGDLTNAIDESCRWKRRRRTEVVLYREGGGNTTLARAEQIPRRFHSRGKVSVSIRKYPLLIDVRRSFVDDVERFGGWNWPEGLLKGRIKFR